MTSQTRVTLQQPFPVLALAVLCALTVIATRPAQGQTFTVLHTFTGGVDGSSPYVGVTIAQPGLLYGTTYGGGTNNDGVVFALHHSVSGWTLNPLHEFAGGSDGEQPTALLTIGPNGALYGTTEDGGSANAGTVFELRPPANACLTAPCYWRESILYSFQGGADGTVPTRGALIFDQAGNIYGMTSWGGGGPCLLGGAPGCGTVFELTPTGSGWAEKVLHSFDGTDGELPGYGVTFDTAGPAGTLYGTTNYGGSYGGSEGGDGTAFNLSPSGGGTWTETVLYNFNCLSGGCHPSGTLIHDASGNLYGSIYDGTAPSPAFELSYFNGGWDFSSIVASGGGDCEEYGGMTMDAAGNLYGTCVLGGAYNDGWVFKLTHSGGSWTTTDLHDFNGSDGAWVYGGVALDSSGNLYGTTFYGGDFACNDGYGCGTVWEITP